MSDDTQKEIVLYEVKDGVALITFNRPQRMNTWTVAMWSLYFDLLEQSADDSEVRVIVVTGSGRAWSAGADMEDLQGSSPGGELGDRPPRPQSFPLSINKPIVAAINGACAGVGLAQALMCDLRFAASGAKFTTAFSRRGLIAEHGTSWILPRLVGPARALDLLLSGRVFLAEEAYELGVVNKVFPPESLLEESLEYARDLAVNVSPASMAVMKQQIYGHLEKDFPRAMKESNRLMAASIGRPDFREGVASFVQKRPPQFSPLDGDAGFNEIVQKD